MSPPVSPAQRVRLADQFGRAQRADVEVPPPGRLSSRRYQSSRSASSARACSLPVRPLVTAGNLSSNAGLIRAVSGSSAAPGLSAKTGRGRSSSCLLASSTRRSSSPSRSASVARQSSSFYPATTRCRSPSPAAVPSSNAASNAIRLTGASSRSTRRPHPHSSSRRLIE